MQLRAPYGRWATGAVTDPCAPGMRQGPKTQTLVVTFPNPGTCRETEAKFTHLDIIPVVFVLLQYSGCVEWGLRHHHGLLEGPQAHGLEPGHPGYHWLPQHHFFQSQMGKPRLREVKEPDWSSGKVRL